MATTAGPKSRKGEATRQTIVDHALSLSSVVGLEGLTIGRLAEDLRLSKSGLFAHFKSKEALQLKVLDAAAALFVEIVVRPAMRLPRGRTRVRALLDNWLRWSAWQALPGGCIFVTASIELDDRPGPVRDALVRMQHDWIEVIARTARAAVSAGDFREDLDSQQFAQEAYGIALAHYHFSRLLHDSNAQRRTHIAFESLIDRASAPA